MITTKQALYMAKNFIVIPDALYDQCSFYVNHLRGTVSHVKSGKVFLTVSSYESQMNQTNVTASLTATFKLANVLKANDYQRVSCTRIRCAIATFACNDGGFETSFFARRFMKNREEMTNLDGCSTDIVTSKDHSLKV